MFDNLNQLRIYYKSLYPKKSNKQIEQLILYHMDCGNNK